MILNYSEFWIIWVWIIKVLLFISVYKIWIQYTNLFKRYQTETIFQLFFNIDKGP